MLIELLLAVAVTTQANAPSEGNLVATIGQVSLTRSSQDTLAQQGASLLSGDRLRTAQEGGALLQLDRSAFIYVGPSADIVIRGSEADRSLQLIGGELRVSISGTKPFRVQTSVAEVNLAQGVVRVAATPGGTRIWAERGPITVADIRGSNIQQMSRIENTTASLAGNEITLQSGQELFIPRDGAVQGPRMADKQGWLIDPRRWQLRSAEEAQLAQNRTRGQADANQQQDPQENQRRFDASADRGGADQDNLSVSGVGLGFGGLAASTSANASAGLFADAMQFTTEGQVVGAPPGTPFPGNIHLITGESRYAFGNVSLNAKEKASIFRNGDPAYFSIGRGAIPDSQVSTSFNTATSATPKAVAIPHFDAYILRLDQYGPIDAALNPGAAEANNIGYSGLLGNNPSAPIVTGADPLQDERAKFNEGATFALGEFRLRPDGGTDQNSFELAVRRSDQDRKIVKDPGGDDAKDKVTKNPDVKYDEVADPRFFPTNPTVFAPKSGSYDTTPTRYSKLDNLRRAAVTTVMADQLYDYSRRTGQTRFVIDGKIVDIKGYRR